MNKFSERVPDSVLVYKNTTSCVSHIFSLGLLQMIISLDVENSRIVFTQIMQTF